MWECESVWKFYVSENIYYKDGSITKVELTIWVSKKYYWYRVKMTPMVYKIGSYI